jgi:holo-[acyl-carrier protein] synthase
MIIGLGNDMVDIRRIEQTLERYGSRFVARIFTDIEQKKSDRRAQRAASYAKRFAAKEACSKALGTGFHRGVFWKDMGVVNEPSGRPTPCSLRRGQGATEEYPGRGTHGPHPAMITDDYPYAQAIVIIDAVAVA